MRRLAAVVFLALAFLGPARGAVPAQVPDRPPITLYDPAYSDQRHIQELKGRLERLRDRLEDVKKTLQRFVPIPRTIVQLGRVLQSVGLRVSEHPAFGGVEPVHATASAHYAGRAIDVNASGDEATVLDRVAAWIRRFVPGAAIIWRAPGHYDHLHAEL